MSVNLSPFAGAGAQFFTDAGTPLTGGLLYTYAAGTTTPATTYTDSAGAVANSNPIVLDAAGRVPYEIRLTAGGSYKFILKTSVGATIGTWDNIDGVNDVAAATAFYADAFTTTAGQTTFTLSANPGSINNLNVSLDGATLVAGDDFTWAGTTIVLSMAAYAGQRLRVAYSSVAGVKAISPGSVVDASVAVGTKLYNRINDIVDVKDFGADPTGVSDSTVAFQNAISASGAYGGYGAVYVPNGTYKLSALVLDGVLGLTLKGENGGNVGNLSPSATGGASALNFTNTTGDSLSFTAPSYNAAAILLEDIAIFANTTGYALSFLANGATGKQVSQIYLNRVLVTNAGGASPTTGNGIRFASTYLVSAKNLFVVKTGTLYTVGQGVTIDMGALTSFLGGEFNFTDCTLMNWQTGLSAGNTSTTPSANENYANVNLLNCELNSNGTGAQFLYGVKGAVVSGTYIEGCLQNGVLVANQAKNVTIEKCFFNNGTASSGDIVCGVNSGSSYPQFYNVAIRDSIFIAVKIAAIATAGAGTFNALQNTLVVENCSFTLGTAGAKGISSNVATTNGNQWFLTARNCNSYGFASGNGFFGQFTKIQGCIESSSAGVPQAGYGEAVLNFATYAADYQVLATDPETVVVNNTRIGARIYAPVIATSKGRKQFIANITTATQALAVWNGLGTASLGTLTAGQKCIVWNDGANEYFSAI